MNKRGLVSNFIAFLGATIAIVLILGLYVLGGSVVKKMDTSAADVATTVLDEGSVEIVDVFNYSEQHVLLSKVKVLVAGGKSIDAAISEVGYDK